MGNIEMANNLKYEFTKDYILNGSKTLRQIKALKSFSNVKKGDLGGYIEKEDNLSQEGQSWVYKNAKVFDDARVCENAKVFGFNEVFGNSKIYGDAQVYGNSKVYGNAIIRENAKVFGDSLVYDNAIIYGNAMIFEKAKVYNNAEVFGKAHIYGDACVYGYTKISGDSWPISPMCINLSKHSLSSYSYNHIKIGCEILTIDEWKDIGEDIAKKYGYSDKDIRTYTNSILFAEKYIELVKKETNNG